MKSPTIDNGQSGNAPDGWPYEVVPTTRDAPLLGYGISVQFEKAYSKSLAPPPFPKKSNYKKKRRAARR